jgi:carbamoyltransferase
VVTAGGVASNIKANQRIRLLPEVDDLYVFPHMGDGGLAVGAAYATAHQDGVPTSTGLPTVALGPAFSHEDMAAALQDAGLPVTPADAMATRTAHLLLDNRIVLWFQGRMEYGPRALGQRSVLARPDRPLLRDRLNRVLKRRSLYQPFCPSVLEGEASAAFLDWSGPSNPFMTMSYTVSPQVRELFAGVLAPDQTCRPHIVSDDDASPFADVLRILRREIGVGAVLNTSFNIHGEPMVCTPQEAVDVFLRCGADALALGPFLVTQEDRQ